MSRAKKKPDDNDKFVRNWKINQTEQLAGRAARTERAMQRLDVVEQPRQPWQLRLSVASAERSGDVVARLDRAVVEHGSFTLVPVDLEVDYGERVVIPGANSLALMDGVHRMVKAYSQPRRRSAMQRRGMQIDWSWTSPAEEHIEWYRRIVAEAKVMSGETQVAEPQVASAASRTV